MVLWKGTVESPYLTLWSLKWPQKTTKILKILYEQKYCKLGLKRTKMGWSEWRKNNSQDKGRFRGLCQGSLLVSRGSKRIGPPYVKPEDRTSSLKLILRPWNLRKFVLLDWKHNLDQWCLFFSFNFNLLEWECPSYACPTVSCKQTSCSLFSSFRNRNFASGWTTSSVSPTPDLDNLENDIWAFLDWLHIDEIWNLELMLNWVKTLGDIGTGWIYFVCGKDMSHCGLESRLFWVELYSSKRICWNPYL